MNAKRSIYKFLLLARNFFLVHVGLGLVHTDSHGTKYQIQKANSFDMLLLNPLGFDHGLPYLINSLCPRHRVAIDVGANAGYYSLPLAQSFSEVFAFDFDPRAISKLRMNVELNQATNIVIWASAVQEECGTSQFYLQDSIDGDARLNIGLSSLVERGGYVRSSIQAEAVTLDSIFTSEHNRVDFIKIDVEGTEFRVLLGARETISTSRPVLLWEASFTIGPENVRDSYGFLDQLGYIQYVCAESDSTPFMRVRSFAELQSMASDVNVLSLPKEYRQLPFREEF